MIGGVPPLALSLPQARRLAVMGAMLAAPKPRTVLEVVEGLFGIQMDPVSPVARAEQLVVWSRLGPYDTTELERLRFETKELFEYWAFIVPASDYAVHRETMRRNPRGDSARAVYIREWLAANKPFERYVLRELRRRGPLRSRELEDRAVVPWRTGGWNDGKSLTMMLERLWFRGKIATVGRDGQERIWDLAERVYPVHDRLSEAEVARRVLDAKLRVRGIARPEEFDWTFDGRQPGSERALGRLVREGRAVPATVEGLAGEWYAHAEVLEQRFRPRTTLLAPFDKLIADRKRTLELFGFEYALEMYVPPAKRRWGYYVLPVLHGDRLVGRIDPLFDRKSRVLKIQSVHWEDGPVAIDAPVRSLARWVGAQEVEWPSR
jgi:uncharacterized protein YcaQ